MRAVVGGWLCFAGALIAQPAAPLRFEVASIKPAEPVQGNFNSGIRSGHGSINGNNVTLKRCIIGAFGIGPNEVVGGPDWMDRDRFEIQAKADWAAGDGDLMKMLQTLLAERFKLAYHRETRPMRAYLLEVAKGGSKMEPVAEGEASTSSGTGSIGAKSITMDRFAEVLSRQMDLPVVNRTELAGAFNFKLVWTPDDSRSSGKEADRGPSIFTAIQEQLGLRLTTGRVPLEVVVIDAAERPTEN